MKELGLRTETGLAITGTKAYLNEEKKDTASLALLGELDALRIPEHAHANPETDAAHCCGHHAQMAGIFGAALALTVPEIAEKLDGQVVFFATPAEEYGEIGFKNELRAQEKIKYGGGKCELIRIGAFDDIDLNLAHHTTIGNEVVIRKGSGNGFVSKVIRYKGKAAHAAGSPHLGVNALNAAALGLTALQYQRETFQDKDTVDKAVRNACSAFLFGTRCNEFSNLIRTMYPLNDDDVIHYLSSPSDWAEETSSVITASNGTASRIYYMARLIAIDRMSELFLTFYEHDSADPKDITNVCKSMMDAVEPYKVVTLVMDYIDDKKMGEHLEVDCPSHLIRDADVLRRKGISVTRISAFAKPEDTQRFVCKHPNLIKQVEKGTNMFDVFVFPIDCITRIRAGEKVLWTNPAT